MDKQMPKVGVLMYTYNRTDDAFINMEIIRDTWKQSEVLKDVVIVHSFNGEKEWWPEKYLEDELLYLDNSGHFAGAEILINEGVKTFQTKYPDIDYVILLASDTWLVKPEYVEHIILTMQKEEKYLATCAWGSKEHSNMFEIGMALDFMIIDMGWTTKHQLFPLRYTDFRDKYIEILLYQNTLPFLERTFALRFKEAILRSTELASDFLIGNVAKAHVHHMIEREPVHSYHKPWFGKRYGERKMFWSNMGLITHHDPSPKQVALGKFNLRLGGHGLRFMNAGDLSYYNRGLTNSSFVKNSKNINYERF